MDYVILAFYRKPITRNGKPKAARVVSRFSMFDCWMLPIDRKRYTFYLAVDEGTRYRLILGKDKTMRLD